jgi:hypothetical protein
MIKKLLLTILFTLVLTGGASANNIFYCIDQIVTGMEGNYKAAQKYTPERFNVKFSSDFKNIKIDGVDYSKTGDEVLNIYIDDTGTMIRFFKGEGNKLGYHRSTIFGMSDAIYVANGECEKF